MKIQFIKWALVIPVLALLAACGGGGGGGGGGGTVPTSYTVSATAGANGSISPSSATVNSGATTNFTVTPDSGYSIASVTGCGGSLAGNTYTTGPITADCAVVASFVSGPTSGSVSGLFYNSGSISMVDPANPSATPALVEAATTKEEVGIWDGVLDIAGQRVTGLHTRTIIYANTDAGMLYKISALKSDPQTPTQVSNEIGVAVLCEDSTDVAADWANHSNSVYIYMLPGADDSCMAAGDNVWKMVRLGMDATVTPIAAKEMELALFDSSTGAIIGFLALDGGYIVRCDQDFQNCANVVSFVTSGRVLEDNSFIGAVILRVDDKLYHYNDGTRVLSAARHTFSGGTPSIIVPSDTDGTNVYFADGDKLYTLPMDGSAPSSLLATAVAAGGIISSIDLTTNRVVYTATDMLFKTALESVSKSGGTPTTLSSVALGYIRPQTAGGLVYYNKVPFSGSGPIFGVINDDGTGGTETPNAKWAGLIKNTTQGYGETDVTRVVWTEGCSLTSCALGTIKSVDATTNSGAIDLGAVPADIEAMTFFGFGSEVLGMGTDGATSTWLDIFFVDVSQAGSLLRITTTATTDEYPIF